MRVLCFESVLGRLFANPRAHTPLLSIGGLRVDKHRSVQCVGVTMCPVPSLRVAVVNARQAVLRLTQLLGLAHARMHA